MFCFDFFSAFVCLPFCVYRYSFFGFPLYSLRRKTAVVYYKQTVFFKRENRKTIFTSLTHNVIASDLWHIQ